MKIPDPPPVEGWHARASEKAVAPPSWESSRLFERALLGAVVLCTLAVGAVTALQPSPRPQAGRADKIATASPPPPPREIRVEIEAMPNTGHRPVWRDLFQKYGLSVDVRNATLANFNAQLNTGEDAATPDSALPLGREIVIIFPATREGERD